MADRIPDKNTSKVCEFYSTKMLDPNQNYGSVLCISLDNFDYVDLLKVNNTVTVVSDKYNIYNDFTYVNEIDLRDCLKDMKFDCIIMNPPYEGNKNLYGKITLEAKKHGKEVVCLSPYLNYLSNSQKKANHDLANELEKYLDSFEFADPKMFDAAFDKKLCIFHFSDNCKHNVFFDQIYWSQFKNPDLTKSIIEKMLAYPSHCYDKIINKNEFDEHAFKIAFSGSRGHKYDGNPSWDWTTLFDDDKMANFTIDSSQKGDLMGIPFNTEDECKNFVKYANTDIFEYAILVQKNSFATDKWLFKKIPFLPTYKKEWTERDIQNEINLTDEEMDYIHEEMKDFGWKAKNKQSESDETVR